MIRKMFGYVLSAILIAGVVCLHMVAEVELESLQGRLSAMETENRSLRNKLHYNDCGALLAYNDSEFAAVVKTLADTGVKIETHCLVHELLNAREKILLATIAYRDTESEEVRAYLLERKAWFNFVRGRLSAIEQSTPSSPNH